MSDDLNLLITILTRGSLMDKIAIKVTGVNTTLRENVEFYNEPEVVELILDVIPTYLSDDILLILDVEEIREIEVVS